MSTAMQTPEQRGANPTRKRPGRARSMTWFGVVPFFAFVTLFLLLPSVSLVVGAFQDEAGGFTLENVRSLFESQFLGAYKTSIGLSALTAFLGGVFGGILAYAALTGGTPRWVRPVITTFSGVAANFAGVPLVFAFIATLGTTGIVTQVLNSALGLDLYDRGFSLFTFTGLAIIYLYFQIPLMILVIAPAIDGLRREWREAASNLGASSAQYWRYVALPILMPSILGAMVLLFANAFAAYATPYALTSGQISVVPVLIGQFIRGDVLANPHQGHALALGMIVVIALSTGIYTLLQRRAARWTR
ncbi:MAG: ABC transporter permease subunit [Actinomycetota bacterium]|nr:ABC transporter permease subunit [Actinomycetota bacterium]